VIENANEKGEKCRRDVDDTKADFHLSPWQKDGKRKKQTNKKPVFLSFFHEAAGSIDQEGREK